MKLQNVNIFLFYSLLFINLDLIKDKIKKKNGICRFGVYETSGSV